MGVEGAGGTAKTGVEGVEGAPNASTGVEAASCGTATGVEGATGPATASSPATRVNNPEPQAPIVTDCLGSAGRTINRMSKNKHMSNYMAKISALWNTLG